MKYNIRGDKLVVTEAINNYVESKLDRLNKYFKEDDILANVLLRVRGNDQIIEVTIPTDKFILRSEEEAPEEEDLEEEIIVKRKSIEMKPMDEEEAILEMNLLGHEFFVYKDMHTDKVCVLYKRKDGNYGLIETA